MSDREYIISMYCADRGVKCEEIVRCKDCVHAEPEREPPRKRYEGLLWCDYLTEGIGFSVSPHNFCAWGERKVDA